MLMETDQYPYMVSHNGFNTANTAVQVSYPGGSLITAQVRLHECGHKKHPANGTFLNQPHHRRGASEPVWDFPTEWSYLTS